MGEGRACPCLFRFVKALKVARFLRLHFDIQWRQEVLQLKRRWAFPQSIAMIAWLLAIAGAVSSFAFAAAVARPDGERSGVVWVVPVQGAIDLGLASFVERSIKEALEAGAVLILVEVNTFGGRVDAATEIRDLLVNSRVPTAAFVSERAWSAGALITLAAESIWMRPGSSIGAAQPIPADAKTVSALRAEFEATAERMGRDPMIAAAMVDVDVEVEGLVPRGEILTLTANRALDIGYAEGLAASRQQVLEALGVADRPVIVSEPNWAENIARFLSDATVSQLLLTLGFMGLIAEATSPGLGVPGAIGLISLALFYGGRLIVGLAGWEHLFILVVGLILIAMEIFVIPGLGIAGIVGAGAIVSSLVLSFGGWEEALRSLGISMAIALAGAYFFWRYGRRSGWWGRVVLSARLGQSESDLSARDYTGYIGKEGVALTTLRPVGTVEVEGEPIDAVSESGYVAAGRPVVVRRVEAARVVVREVKGGKGSG